MKTQFTPIAMRCNEEQFKAIKPKLKNNIELDISDNFKINEYLVNDFNGTQVGNCSKCHPRVISKEVYEEWNEEIFLNACGIKTEQTYTLNKEQVNYLLSIDSVKETVLEWFPDLKPKELEVGKWYKSEHYLICYCGNDKGYGFDLTNGYYKNDWYHNILSHISGNYKEATPQEVQEALEKEAVNRGLIKGCRYINARYPNFKETAQSDKYKFDSEENILYLDGNTIFYQGKWAEIIKDETPSDIKSKIEFALADKEFISLCEKYFGGN